MAAIMYACVGVVLVGMSLCDRVDDHFLPQHSGANGLIGTPYHYENVNDGDGTYRYSYDANGISVHESGSPRAAGATGAEGAAVTAEGGFSYRAPDGQQISLTYTADENGFHPSGAHLPTPPPIPEAIQRSIEFNRQHQSSDDGSYNGNHYY